MRNKIYIVYYKGDAPEDCSVFYCWVVLDCKNKKEAIKKVCARKMVDENALDAELAEVIK